MAAATSFETAIPNAKQREEWNDATGARWLEQHAWIDRQIAPLGRRAMDRADVQHGERVLDVGCGCGETTVDLAGRVGETGLVLGVDVSALLLAEARMSARQFAISNVQFEEADAQTYSFPGGGFDLIFSRFGIMFFDNPIAAFQNLRSALKRGGRIAFVCWPAARENLYIAIPLAVAAAHHIALPAPSDPDAPGQFAFANPDRVRQILSEADFTAIEIERVTERVGGRSVDDTIEMLLQLGPLGNALNDVDDDVGRAVRADIRSALSRFEISGCVWLDAVAWLATARA